MKSESFEICYYTLCILLFRFVLFFYFRDWQTWRIWVYLLSRIFPVITISITLFCANVKNNFQFVFFFLFSSLSHFNDFLNLNYFIEWEKTKIQRDILFLNVYSFFKWNHWDIWNVTFCYYKRLCSNTKHIANSFHNDGEGEKF